MRAFCVTVLALAAATALLLVGCGGNTNAKNSTPGGLPGSTLQVNFGDAPSDRVMALGVTINSMTMTNSSGGTVTVISSATPVEMMRLMGTMQPLSLSNVPAGTYTQAAISMGSMTVAYMNPSTKQIMQSTVPGTTATLMLNPPLTVGSTPSVLNMDMDLANSISFDSNGNLMMSPSFKASMGTPGSSNSGDPENGGMHVSGMVSSISGNSFTMSMMQSSQNMTFMTNSGTQFQGMSGMGSMSSGMIVSVDATLQSNGTMLAQNVGGLMTTSGGMMAEGILTTVTGNPPIQLTILAANGAGTTMMSSNLATSITVNVSNTTPYTINWYGVDQNSLPFTPVFSASTITPGQRIQPVSNTGMMTGSGMMGGSMMGSSLTGTVTATEVRLEQQGVSGTVSGYNSGTGSFTLTLPSDAAFAILTGKTSITVYQQSSTELRGLTSIANGASVYVRGLLFLDSGAFKLVATRVMAP